MGRLLDEDEVLAEINRHKVWIEEHYEEKGIEDGFAEMYILAHDHIKEAIQVKVPSAQPEIIRCKDCKHRPTPTRADEGITCGFSVEFPDERCPCQCEDGWYNWYPKNDFYCGYAERCEE